MAAQSIIYSKINQSTQVSHTSLNATRMVTIFFFWGVNYVLKVNVGSKDVDLQ